MATILESIGDYLVTNSQGTLGTNIFWEPFLRLPMPVSQFMKIRVVPQPSLWVQVES